MWKQEEKESYYEKFIVYSIGIVKISIIIFLLWVTTLFIKWCSTAIYNDIQLDYSEGVVLNSAYILNKGETLYRQVNDYPFFVCLYSPNFIWLNSLFINDSFSLASGRLISILSLMIILIIIFKLVYIESKNAYLSFTASLLCIYFYPIFFWTPLYRNDLFGIAFSLLGLWFIIRYKGNVQFLSILFFLIALYTKQTLIAAPIAGYFYLFLRNRKNAILSISSTAILGCIIFLIINFLTENGFYYNILIHNKRDLQWERFFISWKQYVIYFYPVFISLSMLYIIKNITNVGKSPFTLYLITSFTITILTGGLGADLNFFIEAFIAISITSTLIIAKQEKELSEKKEKILILFFYILILFQCLSTTDRLYPSLPTPEQIAQDKKIVEIFRSNNGEILAENMTNMLRAGKKISVELWGIHNIGKGHWNNELFLSDLNKGKFTMIQLPEGAENDYSEEFREILTKNYHIAFEFDGYHPYRGHVRNFIYVLNSK